MTFVQVGWRRSDGALFRMSEVDSWAAMTMEAVYVERNTGSTRLARGSAPVDAVTVYDGAVH